jgi:SAM-dependent methyltransferase
MVIETLSEFRFDLDAYEKFLKVWLGGVASEVGHWRRTMETVGPGWDNFEEYFDSPEIDCINIGSGPFAPSGSESGRTGVRMTAVDPLAYSYKFLKKKHNITAGIIPEYCMVERLTEKYGVNTFDVVYMRNALDHAFSPMFGIMQMIAICKIGGKVVLQHSENEALRENYHGFHQWNLCVENGDFIVWRRDDKYNISKMFNEYVNVIVEDKPKSRVGVIMLKKKDIKIDENLQKPLIRILDEKIFEQLSEYAVAEAYSVKNNIISIINRIPILGTVGYKFYKKFHRYFKNGRG